MIETKLNARQWALKQFVNDLPKGEKLTTKKVMDNFPGVYQTEMEIAKDLAVILAEIKG